MGEGRKNNLPTGPKKGKAQGQKNIKKGKGRPVED